MINYEEKLMEFKDKVLLASAKLNLSQEKFGEILSVSLATISRWKSGKTEPTKKDIALFNELCIDNNITFRENTINGNK